MLYEFKRYLLFIFDIDLVGINPQKAELFYPRDGIDLLGNL